MSNDSGEDSTEQHAGARRKTAALGHAAPATVPITKVHMPIMMVVSLVVAVAGISGAWWKVNAHAESHAIHLDESGMIQGGGVAYKNEVRELQWTFESRLRKMLASIKVQCTYKRGSMDSVCSLVVPEGD